MNLPHGPFWIWQCLGREPSSLLHPMRNFVVVVAWHGGFPRVTTSCTDPRGSTLSPENPLKWAFIGSSFSLPMPILSNADGKMMSAELPSSIRTLWTVLLATTTLITSGSSWGCWQPLGAVGPICRAGWPYNLQPAL